MKKLLLVLVMLLAATMVFAGGSKDSGSRPAAPAYIPKEPPPPGPAVPLPATGKLTVEVFDRGTDGGKSMAHDNEWTNWIKQKVKADLGIDVTFIPVGRWSENTDIVNLMAAGPGSAPDLCYTYAHDMVNAFRDQGGIMDLAPYINSYLPDLKKLLGSDPAFSGKDFINRNVDLQTGKIFSIPSYRVAIAQRNIFIRKDWLDKLGLGIPKDYNEFYNTLKAFKARDPGGVGARLVPYGVNSDARWGLADVIHHHIKPMNDRDRWVYNIADRYIYMNGYKDGVKEMNKWYNEGLIFKDFPLMVTAEDFYNQIKSGVVGAFCQNWDMPYRTDYRILEDLRKNVPSADYIPIDIVNNKDMMDKVGLQIFIPEFSPNKDAALKYLNWLAKPENYGFLQLGQAGINHEMVSGVPRTLAAPAQHPWIQNSPNNIDYTMPMNGVELGSTELNGRALGLGYGSISADVVSNAFVISTRNARAPAVFQATTRVNQYSNDLKEQADDLIAKAITCPPRDFDKVWDAGIKAWLSSGGQEVYDERASLYK
ncbi:MAG: extracellular solute-binding protein [Treponema sp.]|jgi:putative aldouronate transport system substrate-binding protein|nr:extracellular solute-binding protein [Treponema sp.]